MKIDIPKVSIIIPVYGVEKYIERCLDSVINQTLKDIEIIIVNDGSRDNSLKICKIYQEKDNRIQIYSKLNEGLGLTRNYGMDRANGRYIAFLDSDDFVDLDFYEKLYNNAIKNDADATFTNYKIYDKSNNIIEEKNSNIPFEENCLDSKDVLYNMLKVPTKYSRKKFLGMSVWRSIYRLELLRKNNIKFCSERDIISEDIIFNFDFFVKSNKITFIKDTYYYYCENSTSLTHIYREDRFEKNKTLYKVLIQKAKENGIYENTKIGINNIFMDRVRAAIKNEFLYNVNNAKENVRKILNDNDVIEAVHNKNKENFRKDFFDYIIRMKCMVILKLFCYARKKLKQ